jgi:glyoxylase-like metal-dependent hydrolase (beta-lactamase superfamily II)
MPRDGGAQTTSETVPVARVDTILHGFSVASDEGSIGFAGVYLVEADARRILFDCGHVGRRRALQRALANRNLSVGDIDTLVLSHAHWDHIQNADLFAGADVLIAQAELRRLADAPADDPVTPPWSAAILDSARIRQAHDGLELAPGVGVVGLPGHTAGSIGLSVETSDGIAFLTGDAVSSAHALSSGRCTAVHAGEAAAAQSMERVRSQADIVYPGHDWPFAVVDGLPADYLAPGQPGGAGVRALLGGVGRAAPGNSASA